MKTTIRLNMLLGFAMGLMVLGACVGQNSAVIDADPNPEGQESSQGLTGETALNQEAAPDDLGNDIPFAETDPPENANPAPGDSGVTPNPGDLNVSVLDHAKIGILTANQGGPVTKNAYCNQKFNECEADAGNISAKAACGSNHQKCMEFGNCQVEKELCSLNKNDYSTCSYNFALCDISKECNKVRTNCFNVYGGNPSQCENAYKDCQEDVKSKYDHCIQVRNQCSSNYGGNAQQCQTVFNDCVDNI